jgi:hypothetical protein
LDQQFDQLTRSGHKSAKGAESFPQSPHQHRDGVRVQAEVLDSTPSRRAYYAQPVCVIYNQPCVVWATWARQRIEWPHITIHAEHTVCGNYSNVVFTPGQNRFAGRGIGVRVALEACPRQQSSVDQWSVTEAVQEHWFATAGERGNDGKIRHVTRGKQNSPLTTCECRKLFLKSSMLSAMSGDEMRSAATGAELFRTGGHRGCNRGMPGQPKIVVAAEVDQGLPIDEGIDSISRLNEAINRSPRAPKMLAVQLCERGCQVRRSIHALRAGFKGDRFATR